jgi:hypothetical protein
VNCSLPLAERTHTISAGSSSILDAVDGIRARDSVKHALCKIVGIIRDTQTAKPESFHTTEGWFVHNLVTNLAQLQ